MASTSVGSSLSDADKIRLFVETRRSDPNVQGRITRNVDPRTEKFSRELFWSRLIGCLLTTQQKSGPKSAVARFMENDPFLLTLKTCDCTDAEAVVHKILVDFGGLRFTTKLAKQVQSNLERLDNGGWPEVENQFNELRVQKARNPQESDYLNERLAAHCIDELFVGIGPKQSRNLWQWLGLTRYEIPIDSRVAVWINSQNLSFSIDKKRLGGSIYYESRLDLIRTLCAEAGCLPCVLDAAIFWPASSAESSMGATSDQHLSVEEIDRTGRN